MDILFNSFRSIIVIMSIFFVGHAIFGKPKGYLSNLVYYFSSFLGIVLIYISTDRILQFVTFCFVVSMTIRQYKHYKLNYEKE